MAGTFIAVQVFDYVGRESTYKWRITPQALPTGVATYVSGVIAAVFGDGLLSIGDPKSARIEIDVPVTPPTLTTLGEVRNNWQGDWATSTEEDFRLGIPVRNIDDTLLAPGSKLLANLSDSRWTAYIAAINTSGIHLLSTDGADQATGLDKTIAGVRNRKRPREGGSR